MDSGFNDSRIKVTLEDAQRYSSRRIVKNQAEMTLVKKAFAGLNNVQTVLDSPCGIGRATFLLEEMGYITTGIDAGEGAITMAKKSANNKMMKCTLIMANLKKSPLKIILLM